mmetsp:Transcript_35657/g.66003  ORF Transcript_35657/g.66003 Transcript_35657/m.66003 type:complete len:266 (-) Transcript_35657:250-1047(-)|eukprot:CAMPEP_0196131738 /NCGR_PEP_ID=MMETSP0910-20130528/1620_1 /TAXON_ID=49265 /ORGANISM="Thalassiosira rotula, Strain GSO102" /LENGTH=265 /DNA_ID=CAMNT_0041391243 /DNA_START=96 /DNA_END=893 /DNA_ORIENTATION=-
MTDNWDDSDDDWDNSDVDEELEKRLNMTKIGDKAPPAFNDDEEDLTLKDKEADERANAKVNKAKGSALAKKKAAEAAAKEELELARKAMAIEAEMEANMTPEERRQKDRDREEADAMAMADDLFGGVDSGPKGSFGGTGKAMQSGDKVVLKDLKDHLRHAKKVGECIQGHGKVNLCAAFLKEVIQQSKDVLDDDAITDIIKSCNVIKNEKVQQSKRKVKGQAQKSKKADKSAKKKAMDIHADVFGDNDNYDEYDDMGGAYEDDFF